MLMTITIYVRAQWLVGLTGGYSVNTLSTDTHYAYDLNYESRGGLTIGVPVTYHLTIGLLCVLMRCLCKRTIKCIAVVMSPDFILNGATIISLCP